VIDLSPFRRVVGLAVLSMLLAQTAVVPLSQEPPPGKLSPGTTVFVDDGSCPPGQIKKVVAGSNQGKGGGHGRQGAPRERSCVPRPP
jgi:hypothetical protein